MALSNVRHHVRDIKLFHLALREIARSRNSEHSDGNAHHASKREGKFNLCEERNALLRSSFVLKFKNARDRGIIYTKDHRKTGYLFVFTPSSPPSVAKNKRREGHNEMFTSPERSSLLNYILGPSIARCVRESWINVARYSKFASARPGRRVADAREWEPMAQSPELCFEFARDYFSRVSR